jgi:hypothetical protein
MNRNSHYAAAPRRRVFHRYEQYAFAWASLMARKTMTAQGAL